MSSAAARPAIEALPVRPQADHAPLLASLTLAFSDLSALSVALALGYACWLLVNPHIPHPHAILLLLPFCALAEFTFSGHYPGIGLTAVQLLRRICRGITLVYLLMAAFLFLTKSVSADSRGGVILAWAFSLVAVPLTRLAVTHFLADRALWGVPVIVVGAGDTGRAVIRALRLNNILGYRPVACLDDDPRRRGECEGVPVLGTLGDAASVAARMGVRHAIVAIPTIGQEQLGWYLRHWRHVFPRLTIIPNLAGVASLWTEPRDLGGLLGLEIRHNLLNLWNQRIKRAADIVGAVAGLLISAPIVAICALWIRRASPGNPFYTQKREGQGGRTIRIYKLRTMYHGADRMLREYLEANPEADEEWQQYCKLKLDPRIIPGIGGLLRKTSLDELPQLWNVLKGEMSLVGPRPFPDYHNARFDSEFRWVRTQVRPGLTGLWQVSARSDGNLAVQETLDNYYIRNWSPWLDLYILARTIRAVIAREGAC